MSPCVAPEAHRLLPGARHRIPGNGRSGCESCRALFPQVLRIVQDYIRERVDLNGLHPCDVGLQTYAMRIVDLLTAAIVPDELRGEPPLLPRLNRYRRIGSTGNVHFKTVKPVQATLASHLNYVTCDTGSWEQAAVFRIEKLAKDGLLVRCYARNDRLEFNIPYELYGNPRVYEPDFTVRLTNGVNVVVEVKGRPDPDTDAKHQAAKRWISALNHWGQLGEWDFLVCRNLQSLAKDLMALIETREAHIRNLAARIRAEGDVGRLRSEGWERADFARALRDLFDSDGRSPR